MAKWRSNLRPVELSGLLNVPLSTIFRLIRKYGLKYKKMKKGRGEAKRTKPKGYTVQQSGLRGLVVTLPRFIATEWGLKPGDRLQFQLQEEGCVITKLNGDNSYETPPKKFPRG
ncbi:MAG: hypothetical protein L0Z48_12330 [candidate division Zixibacteria bacterium]|nr:hypothetical protein [candidate division Zixibacteria bacterium]MCI0597310.1 hypothetical protein [candidate division Zixibacteria bacterium]